MFFSVLHIEKEF